MLSNKEKQRRFKEKMYNAGFKQTVLWVKRIEGKTVSRMGILEFMKRLKKLTSGWDEGDLSEMLNLFIKIAKAKKEALKLKNKE